MLLSTVSDMSVKVSEDMVIASKIDLPELLMSASSGNDDSVVETSDIVSAISLYRKHLDDDMWMTRRFEVMEEADGNEKRDWQKFVHCNEEFVEHRRELVFMLKTYETMWDSHIEQITAAKDRLDLVDEDVQRNHAHPYRAGRKRRELENTELKCMLKEYIAEPWTTKESSTIVLAPKKDE